MLTWLQSFGKHYKWLFMGMLGIFLLSFIVGIGAVPRGTLMMRKQDQKLVLGVDFNDQDQVGDLKQSTQFTLMQLYGRTDISQQDFQNAVFERVALQYLADQWQLPQPTDKQLQAYIQTLPAFLDQSGKFSLDLYTTFKDQIQTQPDAARAQVAKILTDDCRLQYVQSILGGPGYALPFAAQFEFALLRANYDLDIATLDYNKFDPKIDVTDAALLQLFNKNPDNFKQPTQVKLSYVNFPAPAVPASPTPDQLKTFLAAHADEFPGAKPDDLGVQAPAITDAWKKAQQAEALQQAGAAAMKFARELSSLNTTRTAPEFDALVKKYNLTLQSLPVLAQGKDAPADSPVPNDVLQDVAFSLDPQRFFSNPTPTTDGVVMLFLDQSTPAHSTTFAEARADVETAYREQEKNRLFVAHGDEVHAAITKTMAAGQTFAQAAAAQGLTVKQFSSVNERDVDTALQSLYNPSAKPEDAGPLGPMGREVLMALANPASSGVPFLATLRPDDVTNMIPVADTGVIIHVLHREVPTFTADSPDMQNLRAALAGREAEFNSMQNLGALLQTIDDALKVNPSGPTPGTQGS